MRTNRKGLIQSFWEVLTTVAVCTWSRCYGTLRVPEPSPLTHKGVIQAAGVMSGHASCYLKHVTVANR
jgi:hypothetical protein